MTDRNGSREDFTPLLSRDDEVKLAAATPVPVLITAESRVARVACARLIHDNGLGRPAPFVSARPVEASSQTISTEADRVTDADDMAHWFDQAAGGTLFIDDIDGLNRQEQEHLLWRLEEHALGRVRVIVGTGRSLRADIAAGAFSDALFYRLNVIHVDLFGRQTEFGDA